MYVFNASSIEIHSSGIKLFLLTIACIPSITLVLSTGQSELVAMITPASASDLKGYVCLHRSLPNLFSNQVYSELINGG